MRGTEQIEGPLRETPGGLNAIRTGGGGSGREEVFMGAARWLAGGRRSVLGPFDAWRTVRDGVPTAAGEGR
jgi:hypothetical protein